MSTDEKIVPQTTHRVIKFRAWDKEHDKMTISYTLNELIANGGPFHKMFQADYIFMQFAGLHDKNGKEIYEGDICGYSSDPSRFEVIYEKCAFRKKYPDWDETIERPVLTQWDVDNIGMEVLGNVHENPELLKPQLTR